MSEKKQQTKNVPELRFPEFSGKWEERKLGEVYQVKMGQSPASINYTDNNEDTVLIQGNADLKGGKISPRIFTKEVTKVADKNDILLTVRAPVGKLAIAQYKVCIGRGVCSINGNRFLYNYLQKFQNQNKWMKFSQGSTFEAISGKDIRNILIAIPNKDEQQKIGDFFSKLDRQIELEEKKLALLEEQKKGYMQKIFSQELRFKNENGNEYPEWEEKRLGEIAKKITEKNNDIINRNVLTNSAELGVIKQTDYFDKDIANINNLSGYYVIRKNNFVYNPRISKHAPFGPINRNKLGEIGVISPLYFAFEVNGVDYCFMEYYFKSDKWHRFMYENGDSGARSDRFSIKNSDFMNMTLYIPDIREQRSIGALFEKLTKLINKQQNKVSTLMQLKRALLRKIFV